MFIKEALIDLLNELTGAQESIEKVSLWLQQYKDQAPVIAQAWKSFYFEASEEKKLTLLFLVNDVLQHTKRKGPHFVDAFGYILPKCLAECKDSEAKTQIERMLDIWDSREVFHKHIISAMKYNLDAIGMEDSHVKLTDLMDSLDILRSQEKKSSEVLTKLSHRLDTTDFANAFNVTSRKEGDKYAADFDETAHFLDQYCSCLLKQTEARSDMIKKMNTTLFQMEKSEETIKSSDKEYKNQQASLVKTRKAITSRQMLIDEGMVNFGDDSPDREQIENLTSEEEDVDIEGIETVEYCTLEEVIRSAVSSYTSYCLNLEDNMVFKSLLDTYKISKEASPIIWICVYYLAVNFIFTKLLCWSHKNSNSGNKAKAVMLSESYVNDIVKSTPSCYQVMVVTGHYGPKLPGTDLNSSNPDNSSDRNNSIFGPALPNANRTQQSEKFGPSPPASSSSTIFGPVLPKTDNRTAAYGPALPSPVNSIASRSGDVNPVQELAVPIQRYPSFGPALPPARSFSSFPSSKPNPEREKFGPVLPNNGEEMAKNVEEATAETNNCKKHESNLPSVPENCHTSIERLLLLYNTDPEVNVASNTNLQQVFGGSARGYNPNDEEKQPKIISKSLPISPKKDHFKNEKISDQPEHVVKSYLGTFEPPRFSNFPSEKVEAVIKGKVDGSHHHNVKESISPRSHDSKRSRSDSGRKRSSESSRRSDRDSTRRRERERSPEKVRSTASLIMPPKPLSIAAQEMSGIPSTVSPMGHMSIPNSYGPPVPHGPPVPTSSTFVPPIIPPNNNQGTYSSPVPTSTNQVLFGSAVPLNMQPNLQPNTFGPPMPPSPQLNRFVGPSMPNSSFGPPMPPGPPNNNFPAHGFSSGPSVMNDARPRNGPMPMNNMRPPHGPDPGHFIEPHHRPLQMSNMMPPHSHGPMNHMGPPHGPRQMMNSTISPQDSRAMHMNMGPPRPRNGPHQMNKRGHPPMRFEGNIPLDQHFRQPMMPRQFRHNY